LNELFSEKCENYQNEVFEISKYCVENGKKYEEFELINNFTSEFLNEIRKSYDFELFFVYGNQSNVSIANYFKDEISAKNETGATITVTSGTSGSTSGEEIEINVLTENVLRNYSFNKDTNFDFLMKLSKEKEVYLCS
jgi:hypothetical protein